MNFPDLETCRLIGAEFPDSEYVWVECSDCGNQYTAPKKDIDSDRYLDADEYSNCDRKIIANAPTCEELGEWIAKPHQLTNALLTVEYQGLFVAPYPGKHGEWFLTSIYHRTPIFHIKAPNETQARAEAVEFVLERQQ